MFEIKVVAKIKTHILCVNFLLNGAVAWDRMEKYSTAGQITDGNIMHA